MDAICILKFAKGHNSVKNVDGVMVLVLSALRSFAKVSHSISVMDLNSR